MRDDVRHMHHALRMASRGLGRTWPNPSVGCVLIKDGRVVGAAHSAPAGGPHAETRAMEQAGAENCRGATAYVTLEPCSHHGKTPPCANALINAGIARVVIACTDPDIRVNGRGIALLREAGIEITTGILEAKAHMQHAGFFSRTLHTRPYISLKIATSADGMVANARGESKWITGAHARAHGHSLRANHDAILTGIGTVLADNPALTCRLPGLEDHSPIRVVLDSNLKMPPESQLAQTSDRRPVWVLTQEKPDSGKKQALERTGIKVTEIPQDTNGNLHISHAVALLAEQGITRLLVEAGPRVSAAFLQSDLVDRLYWYRASMVLGAGSLSGFPATTATLADTTPLHCQYRQTLGDDVLEVYDLRETRGV